MTKQSKIPSTDESWESGKLGCDEEFVGVVADDQDSAIDSSLELKKVSIRLQTSLVDDFKVIAKLEGLGYQPLMRQVLTRFAQAEKKKIFNQMLAEMEKCVEKEKAATVKLEKKTA